MPPELVLEWRRAMERRELAIELLSDIGEEPQAFTLQAERSENPEIVGQRIRRSLNVTDSEQSRWRDQDGRTSLRAWRDRIEMTGTLVFQATRIGSDEASGFAIAADRLPVIVINRKDAPVRRTFSLLHEFAHLMLRVGGVSDLDTDASRPPEEQAVEVFCNQVAAAALVPRDRLLSDPRVAAHSERATDWTDLQIADLARSFGVGREMLLRRLLTLGRTTWEFYGRKRVQYQAECLALQALDRTKTANVEVRRNMPLETVSNYGRPLVQMILENYYQDRLSLSEVVGYLGIKTKHIPRLEQMAGSR